MLLSLERLKTTYLRKSINSSRAGELTLDGHMMHVFFSVKDDRPASMVIAETGLEPDKAVKILTRLIELGLIEVSDKKSEFLGSDFFSALVTNLRIAIGPIAEILIDEAFAESGISRSKLRAENGAAIVRTLASEIADTEAKHRFIRIMTEYLR